MNDMMAERLKKKSAARVLVLITGVEAAKKAERILHGADVRIQYQSRGAGTATSEMMDYVGLGGTTRVLTWCVVPQPMVPRLMAALDRELRLGKPNTGVAFTLALSGVSNPVMRMLDETVREAIRKQMESEVEKMTSSAAYSLILAAVNQGFSEDVMEAGKGAGATGGTVIHARRLGMEDTMKFWGITVQPEKEVVAILAPAAQKMEIMRAIGQRCGMQTPAHGLVLSMPVDAVAGLDMAQAPPPAEG
ncbi:hypothetical protein LJC64_01490 [Ruminococcaceae bacterium OttesenSCG-928-A11]|nr:hypothetical protein [Ruminococcaceae bacterium OttesenSCG-928-A11]